jgi:hypothetical protein
MTQPISECVGRADGEGGWKRMSREQAVERVVQMTQTSLNECLCPSVPGSDWGPWFQEP